MAYLVRDDCAPLGGDGEIRTHDTVTRMPVFETSAFNRSATSPFERLPKSTTQTEFYPADRL